MEDKPVWVGDIEVAVVHSIVVIADHKEFNYAGEHVHGRCKEPERICKHGAIVGPS